MSAFNWVIFAVLALYALSMILLLFWGATTAFKAQSEFRTNRIWPTLNPTVNNFSFLLDQFYVIVIIEGEGQYFIGMGEQVLNTILYAGVGSFLMTLAPCVVAYAVTKFENYFYSKVLHTVVIVAMILPVVGAYPSMIQVMQTLGIYDTFLGLWLQKFNFLGLYFLTFCAAYKNVSKELSEAAYIDGANEWQTFLQIVLPMVRNMFFTVFLIHFVEMWNDYQVPLLYLPSHPTLAGGVHYLVYKRNYSPFSDTPVRLACCMILAIPILILFIIFRNKLMGNVSMGGVKE